MKKTVFIPDAIDEKLALKILTTELLGTKYICCDCTCSGHQANAMIVRDILAKYLNIKAELLVGRVYGGSAQ